MTYVMWSQSLDHVSVHLFTGEADPAEGAEGAAGPAEGAEVAVGVDADAVHPADVAEGEDEHDQEGRPGREALLHTELRRHAQHGTGESNSFATFF